MLDQYQQEAATCQAQRVRVLAGAGSGKTLTLIERINNLVKDGGVPAEKILAVTFSRKAAEDMRQRVRVPGVAVMTLHALGLRILKSRMPTWEVADAAEKRRLIKRVLREVDTKVKFGQIPKLISHAKRVSCPLEHAELFQTYEFLRQESQLWDFDDLLVVSEAWLRTTPEVRTSWQRWSYIAVDETQDTDPLQWAMLSHLVTPDTSLFVVGDYSQSIYRFRGAVPDEMLKGIDSRFGCFQQLELPCNYRSVPAVVNLANDVVVGKPGALSLKAVRQQPGRIWWQHFNHSSDEADWVLEELWDHHHAGGEWNECAILYRTNAQSERFENRLLKAGIPYDVAGDFSFYARAEIKDIVAYLRLAMGWDRESADRVYNRPSRYLGVAFMKELERQGGWTAAARHSPFHFSRAYMADRLSEFVHSVETLQGRVSRQRPEELVRYIYDDIGYRRWLVGEEPDSEDEVKDENLEMFLESVKEQSSLQMVLDLAKRAQDRRRSQLQAVQLLTIHRAKGLEWKKVWLVGCNEGIMPHRYGDPEEEVRIFYVGLTRAKDKLTITSYEVPSVFSKHAMRGGWYGEAEPSVANGHENNVSASAKRNGGAGSYRNDDVANGSVGHLLGRAGVRGPDNGKRKASRQDPGDQRRMLG